MAKICIIMSVFNQEHYIQESINSILNQSYNDFLLIIINDGSTDKTEDIIKSFTDKRIRLVANEGNKGLIFSLNRGIDISLTESCDYIARMDGDDIAFPDRLLQQVEYLEQHPKVGLLGGAVQLFGPDIKTRDVYTPRSQEKINATFYCYNPFFHPTVMFRSKLVAGKKYSELFPKYEDYGLWIELIGDCEFHNLPVILIKYRQHQQSVTSTYKDNRLKDQEIFKRVIHKINDKLKITLDETEIEILSIITTRIRATIDSNISLKTLKKVINNITHKASNAPLDQKYLRLLLIERAILYLSSNNRKKDIFYLLITLNAGRETILLVKSIMSGRKLTT